jgi:hypothetical protein
MNTNKAIIPCPRDILVVAMKIVILMVRKLNSSPVGNPPRPLRVQSVIGAREF